ncbi:hypothetical protein PMI06_008578, partial [Burkholderia sp. BT03]
IADRISRELSVRPIIIDAHAKVTYGRREVLTIGAPREAVVGHRIQLIPMRNATAAVPAGARIGVRACKLYRLLAAVQIRH